MQLAKVVGSVVSTRKADKLMGFKLLLTRNIDIDTFEEKGSPIVSVDTVGAGEGEIVLIVSGSSSRQTPETDKKPVDSTIVGIVDNVNMLGKRVFTK